MRHLGRMVFALLLAVNGVLAGLLLLSAYSPYVDPWPIRCALVWGWRFPYSCWPMSCFWFSGWR